MRLRYDDQGPWALDGLDLDLAAGKRVAVVGPSGAGKSSIVRVAVRFWEYQEGEIRLGGHDLRSYRPEDVRNLIAVVSQDTHLFNTTILENLRIAAPDADEQAIIRAARSSADSRFHRRATRGLQDLRRRSRRAAFGRPGAARSDRAGAAKRRAYSAARRTHREPRPADRARRARSDRPPDGWAHSAAHHPQAGGCCKAASTKCWCSKMGASSNAALTPN